jgi:DNA recombination protein RmuC
MTPLLYLVLGLALGAIIGWLAKAARQPGSDNAALAEELRQQIAQRETELGALRGQIAETGAARSSAEAKLAAAEKFVAEQRELHDKHLADARASQEKALADLRESFKALSSDALKQNAPEFLRLANETLGKYQESAKGDLAQRQEAIQTLVKPLEEQLKIYQQRLQQSDTAQSAAFGEVKKHLETLAQQSQSLSTETLQLRKVLSSNQARGRWGEETLRRVVEAAGMSAHCDFGEQTQLGDSKPDLIIRLPGDRMIIVDAKVPDLDFLDAINTHDPQRRSAMLEAHATKLKATIRALADRNYPSQFTQAMDYVVMFLPAESLFSAALEGDPDLIIWAAARKIMLATPATLIGLLRAISLTWQQHAQTENARAISDAAQELYSRVTKFSEHFEKIRAGLERATVSFNDAVGSYERMVRPSGERLRALRGDTAKAAQPQLEPIEVTLRLPPT